MCIFYPDLSLGPSPLLEQLPFTFFAFSIAPFNLPANSPGVMLYQSVLPPLFSPDNMGSLLVLPLKALFKMSFAPSLGLRLSPVSITSPLCTGPFAEKKI